MDHALEALAADRGEVLKICSHLDAGGWDASSGCVGWSVKDVISHMGALFWAAADPSVLPDTVGLGTEEAQEVYVESRRATPGPQVLDDYAIASLHVAAGQISGG